MGKSQLSKYENGHDYPGLEALGKILVALEATPLGFFNIVRILDAETDRRPEVRPTESLQDLVRQLSVMLLDISDTIAWTVYSANKLTGGGEGR